ncbi:hypothetical protein RRF57_010682 [Xylaria bambusicola]|uniref:Uncharacterized protein n=1 Tax=Xylaria bambusicola TaxID=326684 RepID=A0AAN7Z2Y9_9PEZI
MRGLEWLPEKWPNGYEDKARRRRCYDQLVDAFVLSLQFYSTVNPPMGHRPHLAGSLNNQSEEWPL